MKHRFIPLLIASIVILTSMSDCVKDYENPVSVKIDGILYESAPEAGSLHPGAQPDFPTLYLYDWGFCYNYVRTVSSDTETFNIRLHVLSYEPFELNKKYKLMPEELREEHTNSLNSWMVSPSCLFNFTGNVRNEYEAVSGWIEFTDAGYNEYYNTINSLEGIFEMDFDDNNGGVIEARDGKFGPINTDLYDYREDQ